jgi:tRNA nucleotidyltransferase (CCA-adding enzyme)
VALFAKDRKVQTYAVGGFVRDLLLKRSNFDLDIVVEGDAVKFARDFAIRISKDFRKHRIFGTATVYISRTLNVDFITAREETYECSGALPDVTPKTISEDLCRRDFTINAMALPITVDGFGDLMDPHGGKTDLEHGLIRILHDNSFVDDPTRIYRAIRYMTRFGFTLEKNTERELQKAVAQGVLKNISNYRIQKKVVNVLKEPEPLKTLLILNRYHILDFLEPSLNIEPSLKKLFANIRQALTQITILLPERPIENWVAYLLGLLQRLPGSEGHKFIENYQFTRNISKIFYEIEEAKDRRILDLLSSHEPLENGELYFTLVKFSPETILFLIALSDKKVVKERISFYFRTLVYIHPKLNGKDLQNLLDIPPGPHIGELLQDLWEAVLNGTLLTKSDEINFIKERWEEYSK